MAILGCQKHMHPFSYLGIQSLRLEIITTLILVGRQIIRHMVKPSLSTQLGDFLMVVKFQILLVSRKFDMRVFLYKYIWNIFRQIYCCIAAEYAKLPLIPPYLQPDNHEFSYGINFASAGAGALVETRQGAVCDVFCKNLGAS